MRESVSVVPRAVAFGLMFASVFALTSSVAEAQRIKPPKGVPSGRVISLERVRPDVAELKALPSGPGFLIL